MDIGSILLILALLILVALFVTRPIFERQTLHGSGEIASQDHELSSLLAERDRVLNALQELDFDNALGKIPQEDYPGQRARLMEYGAGVLRRIDELEASTSSQKSTEAVDVEQRLEVAIAARRADSGAGVDQVESNASRPHGNGGRYPAAVVAAPDDDLEVLLAGRRRARQEKSTGFCPRCGSPVRQSDQFCPKCGAKTGEVENNTKNHAAGSNGKPVNGNVKSR